MSITWGKSSWRNFPIHQQPLWPDTTELETVLGKLNKLPALVFSGETRRLKQDLKGVNQGRKFILQVGNCSESFSDCNGPKIHNFLRVLLQMSMVIAFKSNKEVIKIGRVAGQYAKPRSSDYEIVDGNSLPCYRGDIVNDFNPTLKDRTPDSNRLLEGYYRSAATLNLIRAFTQGGYGDVTNIADWEEHFFSDEVSHLEYYRNFEKDLSYALNHGYNCEHSTIGDIIYISHEALLLDYEEAFTRIDTTTGDYYSTSAHTLWIGDRTRQLECAHVEFASGIGNPIGIKIGPKYDISDVLQILKKINPKNEEGKIMLVCRFGKNEISTKLSPLIKGVKEMNLNVIWCCDPMHGNTFSHGKYKVRSFEDITFEIKRFFEICKEENVIPGGIHLEITGEYVSECIGGITGLSLDDIDDNYVTKVDPRLNAAQALEIAFIISNLI